MHNLSVDNYKYLSWIHKFPDFNVDITTLPIHSSYSKFMESQKNNGNIDKINKYLSYCLNVSNGKVQIFPYPDLLFNALNMTPLNKIKVVILGQDPYHSISEIPQAMGLSFSVPKGVEVPSSLKNIYNNMVKYNHIKKKPTHGNLTSLSYQGVLLLNTTLTVQKGCPNGHLQKWHTFTDDLIKYISDNTNNVVFLLWGKPAYEKHTLIDESKHKIIVSSHPSGLSCSTKFRNFECFNNTDHFGNSNKYLEEHNKSAIIYELI